MGNFNGFRGNSGDDRKFGGKTFGGGRKFGSFGGPKQMFQTTCSKCGQDCEVPFRPTGARPVFCNNCFKSEDNRRPSFGQPQSNSNRGEKFSAPSSSPNITKEQFSILNTKLDKILEALSSSDRKIVQVKEEKVKITEPKKPSKKTKTSDKKKKK